jgi:hypothetical protein
MRAGVAGFCTAASADRNVAQGPLVVERGGKKSALIGSGAKSERSVRLGVDDARKVSN